MPVVPTGPKGPQGLKDLSGAEGPRRGWPEEKFKQKKLKNVSLC